MINIKNLKKAKKEIYGILDAINNNETDDIICDSYEDYSKKMIAYMRTKDKRYFENLFNVIEEQLVYNIDEDTMKKEFCQIPNTNKQVIDRILELIYNDDVIVVDTETDTDTEAGTETDIDTETDNYIHEEDIPLNEAIENFKWRANQLMAIERTIGQEFKLCGIHSQVMASGKTYIIFRQIMEYYERFENNKMFIVSCFRQEILRDLLFNEDGEIDERKKKFLKDNKIIDLDKFRIINRVHDKTKKQIKMLKSKPSILFVNTDFLKALDKADAINYNKLNFVIVDECHSVSAPGFYKLLKKIKYDHKIPIFGFSATPLREKAEKQLVDIFSGTMNEQDEHKKLNIISSYDFITAIKDDIILPPFYIISEVNKTLNGKIGKDNKTIMKTVLSNALENAPYKKVVGWCRSIEQMKEYYKYMKENFHDNDLYCSSCCDKQLKNQGYNVNWYEFSQKKERSILLCVNRFREGSDIMHLDTAIYLDIIKKRSLLVSLQTSGRVLRKDKEGKKTHGIIIDSFVNIQGIQIEVLTADRIINYYRQLFTLCDENDYIEQKEAYNQMIDIFTSMKYDEDENTIIFRVDDEEKHNIKCKLILKTKKYDFSKLKLQVSAIIDKMYGVEKENKFEMVMEKIKALEIFQEDINFWEEYEKLDHVRLKIMDTKTLKSTFPDIWRTKTWYEVLGTNDKMSYDDLQSLLTRKYSEYDTMTEYLYKKISSKNKKLPKYPLEYYKFYNIRSYEDFKKQ